MPSCGPNCVIIRPTIGEFPPPPPLVRQVHRICTNCTRAVSEYDHTLCYSCAPLNTEEYDYHHLRCLIQSVHAPIASNSPGPINLRQN